MDVGGAVSRGIARTTRVLFRPFNLGAWFSWGFVFWLASLVDPIADWNGKLKLPDFGGSRHASTGPTTLPDPIELPPEIQDALDRHAAAIGAAVATTIVLSFVLGIVFMWIGCRGLMMSYRSISIGYVGIGEAWRETAKPANALFRLHLLVSGIGSVIALPLLAVAWHGVASAYGGGERDLQVLVRIAIPFLLVVGAIGIVVALVFFVARQFLAPILLFVPKCTLREAFARFFRMLSQDTGGVMLFVLARIGLALVLAVISSFFSAITCCIGGLPLLHQTILAPALAFDRAFTLHALASIGPEYAAMAPELPAYAPNPWRR